MIANTPAKTQLMVEFLWIPPELGGHTASPYDGMRLSIRWQRFLRDYQRCARDIECTVLNFDPVTLKGKASCTFSSPEIVPEEWLQEGQLVELLNGFRVLAVGKIV